MNANDLRNAVVSAVNTMGAAWVHQVAQTAEVKRHEAMEALDLPDGVEFFAVRDWDGYNGCYRWSDGVEPLKTVGFVRYDDGSVNIGRRDDEPDLVEETEAVEWVASPDEGGSMDERGPVIVGFLTSNGSNFIKIFPNRAATVAFLHQVAQADLLHPLHLSALLALGFELA